LTINRLKIAAFSILFIYVAPIFIFGQDSLVLIHDYLDGRHTLLKVLAESGLLFDQTDAEIPNLLNGVPRSAMGSEFNASQLLFYFFGPFWALAINKALVHATAFWGMHRLLKHHFVDKENEEVIILSALTFALLPFLPSVGLTIAGQPLALDAFLTIRKGKGTKFDWLIIILISLYQSLVHFLFFTILMGIIWLYDLTQKKQINFSFLGSIILMSTLCLLAEYRYFLLLVLDSGYVSHRNEFMPPQPTPFSLFAIHEALEESLNHFLKGHWHAKALHAFVIIPATLIGLFIYCEKNIKDRLLLILLSSTLFIALFFGLWRSPAIWPLKSMVMSVIGTYRLEYMLYLNPLLWFLIFALSLNLIAQHAKLGKQIIFILVGVQVLYSFYHHDEIQLRNKKITYRQFYATKLFDQIDKHIGKNKSDYKVVSIGIHPSIAIYNGFHTLDGYLPAYPLKHRKDFQKIIQGELDKDKRLSNYFREGNRCYIFSSELTFGDWLYTKHKNGIVQNLKLSTEHLRKLGGEYVFSAVKIENGAENHLKLLKVFDHKDSAWRIFLYETLI
jgi:hypothetical protein